MHAYTYRLTVTFKSGVQWKLGVDTQLVAVAVSREIGRSAEDVDNICLSEEKTGKVEWLRSGVIFLS